MKWHIRWSYPGERTLLQIPWREASRVDAAIMRFAETGAGDIVRLRTDDAVTLRLRVAPYGVRFTLDRVSGVLTVWSIYKLPPP